MEYVLAVLVIAMITFFNWRSFWRRGGNPRREMIYLTSGYTTSIAVFYAVTAVVHGFDSIRWDYLIIFLIGTFIGLTVALINWRKFANHAFFWRKETK